jgi:hypothetical protein
MAISASFTAESITCPAAVEIDYGATVNLALLSSTGVSTVEYEIVGVSSNLVLASAPTITPVGTTASFVADSDQEDMNGIGYVVACTASDGKNTVTQYGLVGVPGAHGKIPPCSNERKARHATLGWTSFLSDMALGFPHTVGKFTTTDATAATAATIAIPTGKIVRISAQWSAVDGTSGDRLMREATAFFQNDAGTVTQKGSDTDVINDEDDASWAATFSISGTDVLVRYQGDASNSCDWRIIAWARYPGN